MIERRDHVLRSMASHGWLSADELDQSLTSTLNVVAKEANPGRDATGRAPHFVAFVGREAATLEELGGTPDERRQRVLTGGYDIQTTLDVRAYDAAVAAVRQTLGEAGDPTTAIASVQPGDGAIKVLFGGLDPGLQFDPASQGRRQPGSSFKPFVYLAALRAGIDPSTVYDGSSPQTLECDQTPWRVRNYEGEGFGSASVDDAMTSSINVVYAHLMAQVGPRAVAEVAHAAGIARDAVTPPQCAMALGGLREGVSPLEQAAAFATFAAKGVYTEPYAIAKISDRDGKVLYEHGSARRSEAFKDEEAGVLTAALERVVQSGTGTAAAIGRPLAGKTGTTENYGNAWFIGYVPQMATAVWVGYPDGDRPMTDVHGRSVSGGSFPAVTFSLYMRAALARVPVQDLYRASFDDLNVRPSTSAPTATVAPPPAAAPPPTQPPPSTNPPSTSPATSAVPRPTAPAPTAPSTTRRAVTPTTSPPVTSVPPAPTVPVATSPSTTPAATIPTTSGAG